MGVPGIQRRGGSGGERRRSLVAVTPLVVLGLAAFVVVINIRHHSSTCQSESARDEALSRAAMERRIQQLENEILQNSLLMTRLLHGLDKAFHATERLSVEDLRSIAQSEATEIGQRRATKSPPPFPEYARARIESSIEDGSLQDLIHTSLGAGTDEGFGVQANAVDGNGGWDWGPQSTFEDDWLQQKDVQAAPYVDIPNESERTRQCVEWSTTHKVIPGFDWGTLPLEDQEKWKAYSCDAVSDSPSAAERLKHSAPDQGAGDGGDNEKLRDERSPETDADGVRRA